MADFDGTNEYGAKSDHVTEDKYLNMNMADCDVTNDDVKMSEQVTENT